MELSAPELRCRSICLEVRLMRSQEEFEAALERVSELMEHPPGAGSSRDDSFAQLLSDIEHYRPSLPEPREVATSHIAHEADELVERAKALLAAREDLARRERLSSFPEDGEGIGPTTGV
jgi:hypothetical protein